MPSVPSFTKKQQICLFLQMQITAFRRNNTTNATRKKKTKTKTKGKLAMVNALQSNLLIALQTQIWVEKVVADGT